MFFFIFVVIVIYEFFSCNYVEQLQYLVFFSFVRSLGGQVVNGCDVYIEVGDLGWVNVCFGYFQFMISYVYVI